MEKDSRWQEEVQREALNETKIGSNEMGALRLVFVGVIHNMHVQGMIYDCNAMKWASSDCKQLEPRSSRTDVLHLKKKSWPHSYAKW